ncbi:MAG: PEP-CTERM sorting domain-containing protein [Candidatus Electrothrix sp. GM3_4]|nr:PEP-CTERM sorting domain-containing protein [Candidatus Electrothrix sp. GM3_4]
MKNLTKNIVPAFAAACLILAAGQAQAVSVSIYSGNDISGIQSWFSSQGATSLSDITILEDFEGQTADWYDTLDSPDLGLFTATGEPGTGSTAYRGPDGAHFEIRDYDANGRYNVYPLGDDGTNYLDSADITELSLQLYLDEDDQGLANLFFTMTDPGDVRGITTINGQTIEGTQNLDDILNSQHNGSLFFVGIDGQGEDLTNVTWAVNRSNGDVHTNDGFGVDSIGTVNVPEPATALLLGAGLLPLMGFLRRKKEEDEV